jgi:hypothetical protein
VLKLEGGVKSITEVSDQEKALKDHQKDPEGWGYQI